MLEKRLIDDGHKKLPLTIGKENYTQTNCDVVHCGEYGVQIVNCGSIHVGRLLPWGGYDPIALLQTCKQLSSECAQVLHGENVFTFTTLRSGWGSDGGKLEELEHFSHWIPGFQSSNGTKQSMAKIEKNVDRIFAPVAFQPEFVARDPLLDFMH